MGLQTWSQVAPAPASPCTPRPLMHDVTCPIPQVAPRNQVTPTVVTPTQEVSQSGADSVYGTPGKLVDFQSKFEFEHSQLHIFRGIHKSTGSLSHTLGLQLRGQFWISIGGQLFQSRTAGYAAPVHPHEGSCVSVLTMALALSLGCLLAACHRCCGGPPCHPHRLLTGRQRPGHGGRETRRRWVLALCAWPQVSCLERMPHPHLLHALGETVPD